MKSAAEQLATYKSVHLNKKNIMTHFIGVPLIIWSLSLLLSLISWPTQIGQLSFELSIALIFFGGAMIYYFMLHWKFAIGLMVFIAPVLYSTYWVAQLDNALWIAISVFVIGWIFQFVGHHYEKAKPAFVDDINQLMIGPFFLMAEIFFGLGLEKDLEAAVTSQAIEKRRIFEAAKQ